MAIKHVTIEDQQLLQEISGSLETARKIVVVTGAGISTSCGIPVRFTPSLLKLDSNIY